jgi:hypothetical protein
MTTTHRSGARNIGSERARNGESMTTARRSGAHNGNRPKPSTQKDSILGKPLLHWETEARKLIIDILVRHGRMYAPDEGRNVSVIHKIASCQLLAMAVAMGDREAAEANETLGRLSAGMANAVLSTTLRQIDVPSKGTTQA